ncbi:T9SS type A sorting domain-containing protein, partial [Flavobacteriaceae bacterium]|nr:T9SS type A sorting domain-containing protein [Flavobacteriaceae bacterium]
PLEYNTNVEPITLVSIAEINNVTDAAVDASPAHEDFTALTANLTLGEAYDITFEGNTAGGYDNSYTVFIDFNQNDILDDAGEVFAFEDVINSSSGTDGQSYTGSIAIPADALEGDTRMRVKKIYNSDAINDPCVGGGFGYGQAEDYTVNLAGVALDPNVLPITLENQLPAFGDFNGSFTQAIPNPDATGANTSATVAENTVPANAAFAGVNFAVDTNIDISAQKGFTMTVWSPVANTPVLLKLENATTGVNAERAATTTTTSAWETVSFDFSTEGDLTFESVTIFMNFNVQDPATQTYYWDNLEQVDVLITGDARISEIDADQTGTDTEEFLEIQTEFANQSLNGMIAVLYNGNGAVSYTTVDLNGFTSDDNGYFLIGTDAVAGADITLGADNKIQNGADGVALYMADAASFPDGTAATDAGLVDAVVYGTNDSDATDLLAALGETIQWNESENGANGTESLQWDDATQGFCAGVPTPKAANTPCPVTSDGLSCATAFVATEGTIVGTQIDPSGDSAWFVYTPSANGSIIVSSCLGGADTVLNIWNDCDDAASAANNDDECAFAPDGTGNEYASEIAGFVVAAGEDYFIQWDDQWSTDPFDWSITFTPAPLVELPITLEGGQSPAFGDFNGSSTVIIPNPDPAGNTSATVAQNLVPANAGFAGVNFPLDTNIDITVDKFFTLKVWSPVANMPVLLKLENASGVNAEIAATTTTTSAWETISFDFSAIGQLTYESVTIFMNFAVTDPADQTYYWDDLELVNEIVVTNDLCENALAIDCGANYIGDTSSFFNTGAPEEDCGTALNTAPGAWHTVTIPADGDYTVTVDTFNSEFDTKLGVFSGTCDALVCIDGNDDTDGLQSQVTFVGTASETYIIYVTGFAANAGVYNLNVACELVTIDCNPVTGITISDITETSAVVSWEAQATALDGYAVGVFLPGSDPSVDDPVYGALIPPTGILTDTATGLSSNTMYEAFVVSLCDIDGDIDIVAFSEAIPFTTLALGLADSTIEGFTFYPNPSSDVINLTATENIEKVAIYNLLGQKVLDQNINATSSQLNVASLVTGTYLMEVSADAK